MTQTNKDASPDRWVGYGAYKKERSVSGYYQAVHHCEQLALKELLGSKRVPHALDIACGNGDSSRVLQPFAERITGIDSSASLIREAQEKAFDVPAEFIEASFQEFERGATRYGLVGAAWFLNHLHSEKELRNSVSRIRHLADQEAAVCFVVPSHAFCSRRVQEMARQLGWQQTWLEEEDVLTRGLFAFGGGWIPTTIWEPMFLMRMLSEYFTLRTWDVKGTLAREGLLSGLVSEPPFEIIYGRVRERKSLVSVLSGGERLSYAAGSRSISPDGFRPVPVTGGDLAPRVLTRFPELSEYLTDPRLIVSAYPALLGLEELGTFVDTYLHLESFIRAMRLAAWESRSVVFASQPIRGADLLLRLCNSPYEMPAKLLWAVGGYQLPSSLERFLTDRLADAGCQMRCLHAYGVAEISHTCFAATDRLDNGRPAFKLVAAGVDVEVDAESGRLVLRRQLDAFVIDTGDCALQRGDVWDITNGHDRLAPEVAIHLEAWGPEEWTRRTGELAFDGHAFAYQLREGHTGTTQLNEFGFHDFYDRFGGTPTRKPCWSARGQSSSRCSRIDVSE